VDLPNRVQPQLPRFLELCQGENKNNLLFLPPERFHQVFQHLFIFVACKSCLRRVPHSVDFSNMPLESVPVRRHAVFRPSASIRQQPYLSTSQILGEHSKLNSLCNLSKEASPLCTVLLYSQFTFGQENLHTQNCHNA